MGMYNRNRHDIGGYSRGHHVNGLFFSNGQLFHYKRNLDINFYNAQTGNKITTTKAKLDWDKVYNISNLPISLPNGYTDKFANANQQPYQLGLVGINVWTTRLYLTWNVVPIQGIIILNFTVNGTSISSLQTTGVMGSSLNINDYLNQFPTNYTPASSLPNITFTTNAQTVNIPLNYQPITGKITVNFIDQSNNQTVSSYDTEQGIGTMFNVDQVLSKMPSGYSFVSIQGNTNMYLTSPQTVSIYVESTPSGGGSVPNSPSVPVAPYIPYTPPTPNTSPTGTINIQYEDMNGKTINTTSTTFTPGFPFDLEPYEINIPNNYAYYQTLQGEDLTTYPHGSTTVIIQCMPKSVLKPNPQSGNQEVWRVFVDETNDSTENPSTFSDSLTTKQQGQANPIDADIYIDQQPISATVPSSGNLTYSDIGVPAGTLIKGPNQYSTPYLDNKSFVNLIEYVPDVSIPLQLTTDNDGDVIAVVECKPSIIHGIKFQFIQPTSTEEPKENIVVAPGNNPSNQDKWDIDHGFFALSYGTKLSAHQLVQNLLNGSKNGKFTYKGHAYQTYNNRKITISVPYTYEFFCKQLD